MAAPDPPTFIVVPDTNTLFDKDIKNIVSAGFTKLYTQHRAKHKLRIQIPEIVRQELIFRQVHAARKSLENARKNLEHIAQITGTRAPKLRSDRDIKAKVKKTFDTWAERNNAKIVKTPLGRIQWKRLIEDAVWRVAPFELAEEGGVPTEKGFRDCLIIETVCVVAASCANDTLVLLSNDNLVRGAFTMRMRQTEKRLLFNSLKDFGSYLKVLEDNRSKEFTQKLIANAKLAFFDASNPNCGYYKLKVWEQIDQRLGLLLQCPPEQQPVLQFPGLTSPYLGANIFSRKPISEQKIFIRDSYFDSADGNRYKWKTRIEIVQLFSVDDNSTLRLYSFSERIRLTEIDVIWSSVVSAQAEISDLTLIDIQLIKNELQFVDVQKKVQYGFPLLGGALVQPFQPSG